MYHYGNTTSILDLPPTSNSIKLHILRAFYATYEQINLLNAECLKLDPLQFGYVLEDDYLILKKVAISFPSINVAQQNHVIVDRQIYHVYHSAFVVRIMFVKIRMT